jgi:hypothetical protein
METSLKAFVSKTDVIQSRYRFLEVRLRKVVIPHSHFKVSMAQELLNRLKTDPFHHQMGSKGVAKENKRFRLVLD